MNWHYQIIQTTPEHLFLLCLLVLSFCASCNAGKPVVTHRKNITCIDHERDTLLKFKHGIQSDYSGLMSSWGNPNAPDCCTWKGVSCSNQSGHVIGLYLSRASCQRGYLDNSDFSTSLGELKHLKYLDLSSNYFYDIDILRSIGSLINLVYLNLSDTTFSWNNLHQLENLTRLTSLDLSFNNELPAKSLNSLSRLTLLKEINLVGTNLSKVKNWSQSIGSLPLLEVLKMDHCELSTPLPSTSLLSANLRIVSLSGNEFTSSTIFQWLFNTRNYSSSKQSLQYLDLSYNFIQGPIPDAIGNLKFLEHLDLSQNSLSSKIPDAIGNLQLLMHMDLSNNSLSGPIPSTLRVSSAMGTMDSLLYFNLSHNRLVGAIASAIGDSHSISHIDLSYNQLQGPIPSSLGGQSSLSYLDLSHNCLEGPIPSTIGDSYSMLQIDLSNNHLQGPIPSFLGKLSSLSCLNLSNNQLEGTIPASMTNLKYLKYLDLSSNNLSGDIPCIGSADFLAYVNLSYNNLSGSMPKYYMLNFGFDPIEAFQGNPNLRTDEFKDSCDQEGGSLSNEQVGGDHENDKDKIYPGLYVSIGIGVYLGFWVFCSTLTVKNSWRLAYFRFLDHITDKIYVTVVVYLARFRRNSEV